MPVLQIKTFRQKSGKVETSHYKATIARLRARLSIALSYNILKGDMRVEGFPDVSQFYLNKKKIITISFTFIMLRRFALLLIVLVQLKL